MKPYAIILTAVLFIGLGLNCGRESVTYAAPARRIKMTTLAPRGSSYYNSLQKMGDEWQKISVGAVKLIIYPGGIQGGEAAMVDRMRVGQSQAGMLTAVGLAEIEPAVRGLNSLPMIFNSLEEVDYVGRRLRPLLEDRLLKKGYVVLFWADAGWLRYFSKSPMITPDDLKKMKLFTWAGYPGQVDIMKSAGYNPVPLETGDILPGLQTGLIDVVPMPPFYALAQQIYTPAPHMLALDWAPLVGAAVVTREAWEEVPESLREKLLEAAAAAGDEIKAAGRRENDESVRTMEEKWGLKIHPVSPEVKELWRRSVEKVYPEIRGGIVPADTFDEVVRLLEEYRGRDRQ
ncbi:MAG: TRAP transporter substrate-binding protein DctP [PVC group bacterium]